MRESTKYWIWFKLTKVSLILGANLLWHFYLCRPWYASFSNSKMFRYFIFAFQYCLLNYLCNAIWIPHRYWYWLVYCSRTHRSAHTGVHARICIFILVSVSICLWLFHIFFGRYLGNMQLSIYRQQFLLIQESRLLLLCQNLLICSEINRVDLIRWVGRSINWEEEAFWCVIDTNAGVTSTAFAQMIPVLTSLVHALFVYWG